MASITIRNLDEKTKARLRVRAAQHGRSMEEEARTCCGPRCGTATPGGNLAEAIRARFRRSGASSFDCPPASRCVSRRSPVDDHPRHERGLGADEAGALLPGGPMGRRPAGGQSLHHQHHPGRDTPRHHAPPARATAPQRPRSGRHVHVRGGLRRADPGIRGDAAPPYARIASDRRRAGRPISHFDAQIAAIARSTGGVLATRNGPTSRSAA